MLAAVACALAVRASQGITGVATEAQVDAAIAAAGLGLRQDRPYAGRIMGRLYRRTVCVKKGLWPGERVVTKGHELGHHLLGHGDAFSVRPIVPGSPVADAAEQQAYVFVYALMVGRPARDLDALTRQMRRAFEAGLPLGFLLTAVSLLAQRRRYGAGGSSIAAARYSTTR